MNEANLWGGVEGFAMNEKMIPGEENSAVGPLSCSCTLPESSVSQSALESWKPASCSPESGIHPHSHITVKYKTKDEEKSLIFPNSS